LGLKRPAGESNLLEGLPSSIVVLLIHGQLKPYGLKIQDVNGRVIGCKGNHLKGSGVALASQKSLPFASDVRPAGIWGKSHLF